MVAFGLADLNTVFPATSTSAPARERGWGHSLRLLPRRSLSGYSTLFMDHPPQVADLLKGMGDELLSAKAGIDAHDQDLVEILENIGQQFDGCVRVSALPPLSCPVILSAGYSGEGGGRFRYVR